jgi:surface protein G
MHVLLLILLSCHRLIKLGGDDSTPKADSVDSDADTDADADADADSDTDTDTDSDTDADTDADTDTDADADPNACSSANACVVYACYCGTCTDTDIQCVSQSWADAHPWALGCAVTDCPLIATTVCSCDTTTGSCLKN